MSARCESGVCSCTVPKAQLSDGWKAVRANAKEEMSEEMFREIHGSDTSDESPGDSLASWSLASVPHAEAPNQDERAEKTGNVCAMLGSLEQRMRPCHLMVRMQKAGTNEEAVTR